MQQREQLHLRQLLQLQRPCRELDRRHLRWLQLVRRGESLRLHRVQLLQTVGSSSSLRQLQGQLLLQLHAHRTHRPRRETFQRSFRKSKLWNRVQGGPDQLPAGGDGRGRVGGLRHGRDGRRPRVHRRHPARRVAPGRRHGKRVDQGADASLPLPLLCRRRTQAPVSPITPPAGNSNQHAAPWWFV